MNAAVAADIVEYCHPQQKSPFLRKAQIRVPAGVITALVGPSGTGKTTLIRILLSSAPGRTVGSVEYQLPGRKLSPSAARKEGLVGFLFQGQSLLPWATVSQNLALPSRLNPHVRRPSEPEVLACLRELNLPIDCLPKRPHQLSFGMKQRVAFARVILYRPRFLFLDEVFVGLDSVNAQDLGSVLKNYVQSHPVCCLLVTHDINLSVGLSSRFFYLDRNGELADLGTDVRKDDLLSRMRRDVIQPAEVF